MPHDAERIIRAEEVLVGMEIKVNGWQKVTNVEIKKSGVRITRGSGQLTYWPDSKVTVRDAEFYYVEERDGRFYLHAGPNSVRGPFATRAEALEAKKMSRDSLSQIARDALDMTPSDWNGLRKGFEKWTREEEKESEHTGDANRGDSLSQIAHDALSVKTDDVGNRARRNAVQAEITALKARLVGNNSPKGSERNKIWDKIETLQKKLDSIPNNDSLSDLVDRVRGGIREQVGDTNRRS